MPAVAIRALVYGKASFTLMLAPSEIFFSFSARRISVFRFACPPPLGTFASSAVALGTGRFPRENIGGIEVCAKTGREFGLLLRPRRALLASHGKRPFHIRPQSHRHDSCTTKRAQTRRLPRCAPFVTKQRAKTHTHALKRAAARRISHLPLSPASAAQNHGAF